MAVRESSVVGLTQAVSVCLVATLVCVPWIVPSLVWCGWLGVAAALAITTRLPWLAGLRFNFAWSCLALAVAFYWAPHALAQTMRASSAWGIAVFAPLVLWEAVRAALPFWLAVRLGVKATTAWFPAALIAVVLESVLPGVFPWRFGYVQVAWPLTIQTVDLFGTEWATLMVFAHAGVIVWLSAALAQAVRSRRFVATAPGILRSAPLWLCAANLAYGVWSMSYWHEQTRLAPQLRVALVQVDPTYLGSADKLLQLTQSVAGKVDLVCWPESSGGNYHVKLDQLSDTRRVFELSRDPLRGMRPWPNPSCPLLLGCRTYNGDRDHPSELYQSAVLLDTQERITGRYYKRTLMPFGEYVPGKDWLPGMDRLFPLPQTFIPGNEATILLAGDNVRLGTMICYEDMNPSAARSMVSNSANLLISLINGASFENTLTLRQHRLLAQLRAVECRRYHLRVSSTGETCVITPLGQVEASLPLQTTAVLTANVALIDSLTWGCRIGNLFPWLCAFALALYARQTRRAASFQFGKAAEKA